MRHCWSAAGLLRPAAAAPRGRRPGCQVSRPRPPLPRQPLSCSAAEDGWFSPSSVVFLWCRARVEVEGVVVGVTHCPQTGTVALQLQDGRIRRLLWGQKTLPAACETCLPELTFSVCVQVGRSRPWRSGGIPAVAASTSLLPVLKRRCAASAERYARRNSEDPSGSSRAFIVTHLFSAGTAARPLRQISPVCRGHGGLMPALSLLAVAAWGPLRSCLLLHSWPPTFLPSPSATTSCSSPRTRTAAAACV